MQRSSGSSSSEAKGIGNDLTLVGGRPPAAVQQVFIATHFLLLLFLNCIAEVAPDARRMGQVHEGQVQKG